MATVVGVLDRDLWSGNTDNIVIADPATRSLTWIPRGLWCPSLNQRVNRAFALGGVEGLIETLRERGFPCDHGLVLRRSATERAAIPISVEVPVEKKLDYWYPLHPTRPIHGPRKPVSFRPPSEHLSGARVHEWLGARIAIDLPSMEGLASDWQRVRRQQILLQILLAQHFDFGSAIADKDLIRISGGEALRELASIDASWRMQTFEDTLPETIGKKMVLVKWPKQLDASPGSPQLAVVVLAVGTPLKAVDAVRSLLAQVPPVEVVVMNSGSGMVELLARHGFEAPVIERAEKLTAGAARNAGIRATRAPYVAFLAADCRATRGWAKERIAAHRAGTTAVGSAMANENLHNPFAWASHLAAWSDRTPGTCSYDRRVFEAYGIFREDLPISEENAFNRRLPKSQRPKRNARIRTVRSHPTRFWPLIASQFRLGVHDACVEQECWRPPLSCGFAAWRSRTGHALGASRQVKRQYRTYVRLARPLIPIAVLAYCLGARYWQLNAQSRRRT